MTPSNQEILHSYRNLLRTGLHAVQYAKPARYTVQSRLRNAYRTNGSADFNAEKIQNTLLFLKNAAKETGLEHRILKNLLHVWWYQTKGFRKENKALIIGDSNMGKNAFGHFDVTLKMLNESMEMCLA